MRDDPNNGYEGDYSITGTVKRKFEMHESDWFCNCFLFNNEIMSLRFLYEVTVIEAEGRISASLTIAS